MHKCFMLFSESFVKAVTHFEVSSLLLLYPPEVTVKIASKFCYLAVIWLYPGLWRHDLLYHYVLVLCFLARCAAASAISAKHLLLILVLKNPTGICQVLNAIRVH